MGRFYRNRSLDSDLTNFYVFIGNGKNKNSGIGTVIDTEIYNISKRIS